MSWAEGHGTGRRWPAPGPRKGRTWGARRPRRRHTGRALVAGGTWPALLPLVGLPRLAKPEEWRDGDSLRAGKTDAMLW